MTNFDKPQNIYITRDLHNKYSLFFDKPDLADDGEFYSKNGVWSDLEDYRWSLELNKGTYFKYTLVENNDNR